MMKPRPAKPNPPPPLSIHLHWKPPNEVNCNLKELTTVTQARDQMLTLVKLLGPETRRHRPLSSPWKRTNLRLLQTLKLEQLDGAGVELSSLYKWIEKQVPNGCCTKTWKNRTHWAGLKCPVMSAHLLHRLKSISKHTGP